MKAALISLGSTSSKWTAEAMRKYFDEVVEIDIRHIEVNIGRDGNKVLYKGEELGKYDCVFGKGSFRYAELMASITSIYDKKCYMPIEQGSFTIVHDKLLTHLDLQKHNIPMPLTYISATVQAARAILQKVNYPIIMKFPKGTQGKGVMVADSYAGASSLLDALDSLKQPFIIQEFIETDGSDIRALVIGDKVVASMARRAKGDEKRANLHAGGKGEAVTLDAHTKKIAVDTAKVLGADICGVDILESHRGPLVIEANISPGLQGITKVTGVDVADKIAKFLYLKTKDFVEDKKDKKTQKIMGDLGIGNGKEEKKQLITTLDLRGNRLLLPELMTNVTKFNDKDEVVLEARKGELIIKKF